MNAIARLVSVVFHPLLMATYLFSILSEVLPAALSPVPPPSHFSFISVIFIVTFALPVLNIAIFKVFGTIDSFEMKDRKERILPFIFIAGIYIAITWLLYSKQQLSLHDNFLKLLMIIDLLVLVSLISTFFFKVSVHSVGIWGMIGITLPLTKLSEVNSLFYVCIGIIILAGFIMAARLQLGAHSSREVMWGSVLGLATGVTGMLLLF